MKTRPRRFTFAKRGALGCVLACIGACATTTAVQIAGAPLLVRGASLEVLDDGALQLSGGPGYAYLDRDLSDVAVRVEVTARGNSGLFVRAAHPLLGFFPSGPEAQIEARGDPWATGAIYGKARSAVAVADGAPFHLCVAVKGERMLVVINDAKAAEATVAEGQGFVALQAHDPWSETTFRRLRIRSLTEGERVEDACAVAW